MKPVTCPACQTLNGADEESCTRCGESLAATRLEHAVAGLREANARVQHREAAAAPSFSSFNGFGTTLLDYRPRGDGTYDTVRWVVAAGIPLVPLGGYVIRPVRQEATYGRRTSSFAVLERTPLSPARVARTYLLLVVGLLPLVAGFLNSDRLNGAVGSGRAFFVMLACIAWAFYVVYIRIKNEGDAYKPLQTPAAG